MLVWVNYVDGRYDYVKDFMLEPLIRCGALKQFKRSSGWARIGIDPVRKSRLSYTGIERRAGAPPCDYCAVPGSLGESLQEAG